MQHRIRWVRGLSLTIILLSGLCGDGFAKGSSGQGKSGSRPPAAVARSSAPRSAPSTQPKPVPTKIPHHVQLPEPQRVSYGVRGDAQVRLSLPDEGVLEAVGVAPYPANAPSRAAARVQARRAAIIDAQRQLVEQLYGVEIASVRTLTEYGLQEQVSASAQGTLQGAQIVAERDWGDSYEVTLRWRPPAHENDAPVPVVPRPLSPIPNAPSSRWEPPENVPVHGYTGVVIDARGLGLQPSMSPRLRDLYGNTLWGELSVEPEVAIEYGIAGWARTEAELNHATLQARLGTRPLWLRAVRVQGAARNEVILSHDDAERLLRENARSGFLERLAVVFLY